MVSYLARFVSLSVASGLIALASTDAAAQSFTDATSAAGLSGTYMPAPVASATRIMSGGVAVGDVDGDGWEDIFWAAGGAQHARLFINQKDGTYKDRAPEAGVDIKANIYGPLLGDFDDDGDLDLFLTTGLQTFPLPDDDGVLPVSGAGPSLGPASTPGTGPAVGSGGGSGGGGSLAEGTLRAAQRNYLYLNQGDGIFVEATAEAGLLHTGRFGSALGDLDGDGRLDLVTLTWMNTRAYFMRNVGGHRFRDMTPANVKADLVWGFTPRLVDYDFDDDIDVLACNDLTTSRLWRNDGGGVFTDVTAFAAVGTDENGMGSTVGDYDRDGDLDWFVTSIYSDTPIPLPGFFDSGNRLYSNDGDGTFTDVTDAAGVRNGGWGWGAQFADLDHDGDLDIVHANGFYSAVAPDVSELEQFDDDTLRVFLNDGSGAFTESAVSVGIDDPDQGRGLVVYDHDHDGALDILVANNDTGLRLYEGHPTGLGNWLGVELRGTNSNHYGVGARVTVTTSGLPPQVAQMECGNNYLSQAPMQLWFGLGAETSASVEVRWPSGAVSVHPVGINGVVTLTEPR
jgi:hypothetical protein